MDELQKKKQGWPRTMNQCYYLEDNNWAKVSLVSHFKSKVLIYAISTVKCISKNNNNNNDNNNDEW